MTGVHVHSFLLSLNVECYKLYTPVIMGQMYSTEGNSEDDDSVSRPPRRRRQLPQCPSDTSSNADEEKGSNVILLVKEHLGIILSSQFVFIVETNNVNCINFVYLIRKYGGQTGG